MIYNVIVSIMLDGSVGLGVLLPKSQAQGLEVGKASDRRLCCRLVSRLPADGASSSRAQATSREWRWVCDLRCILRSSRTGMRWEECTWIWKPCKTVKTFKTYVCMSGDHMGPRSINTVHPWKDSETPGSTLPRILENDLWAKRFGVDGLPHVAFIDSQHHVRTALVGDVPPNVVRADVEALMKGADLPFIMYDAFEGQSNVLERWTTTWSKEGAVEAQGIGPRKSKELTLVDVFGWRLSKGRRLRTSYAIVLECCKADHRWIQDDSGFFLSIALQ